MYTTCVTEVKVTQCQLKIFFPDHDIVKYIFKCLRSNAHYSQRACDLHHQVLPDTGQGHTLIISVRLALLCQLGK